MPEYATSMFVNPGRRRRSGMPVVSILWWIGSMCQYQNFKAFIGGNRLACSCYNYFISYCASLFFISSLSTQVSNYYISSLLLAFCHNSFYLFITFVDFLSLGDFIGNPRT